MADDQLQSGVTENRMKALDDLIWHRRSVRRYTKEALPVGVLEALLHCAQQAPSPSNSQPVRFVRISSGHHMEKLVQALDSGHKRLLEKHKMIDGPARLRNWINAYRRYAQVMFAAPVLLAVAVIPESQGFSSTLAAAGLYDDRWRHQTDLDMTVGLAVQNLLLKAQSLGIGSCILTAPLVFIDDVEALLSLDKMVVKCFVTLGMADEVPKRPERLPLASVFEVI